MDTDRDDYGAIRHWVATWRDAGEALARVRTEEVRRIETAVALQLLAAAFDHALRTAPPRTSSGLVEQQRLFQRLRS